MENKIFRDPNILKPHPENPRGIIDPESPEVISLCEDILKRDLIQPIVINSHDVIQAGHRRCVAAIRAGLKQVPVVIRETKQDEFIEEVFLAENMQRQDLSPLEEARAIGSLKRKLEERHKKQITNKELVRRLNIPPQTISQRLALLELPERVQKFFHIRELPVRAATQLIRLREWPEEIEKFADRMVRHQITLASLDALITRRMHVLQEEGDRQKYDDREARRNGNVPAKRETGRGYSRATGSVAITRETALENLGKNLSGSISMFNVKVIADSICCSCGMIGNTEVCQSCPLPRFINGLVGRATESKAADIDEDDDD